MVLDGSKQLSPNAARRLKAIEEFTELGAGFRIALRDLEIRGAGNILGTQQSGHIAAVGYELYCQLLENAVRALKNEPVKTPLEVNLDLPWRAFLPRDYVPGQRQRIEVYRRLSRVRTLARLADFRQEMRDRFGPVPESAEWLLRQAEVRLLATRWHIRVIRLEQTSEGSGAVDLVFEYRSPRRIQKLALQSRGELRVVDGHTAYLRIARVETEQAKLYARLHQLLHPEAATLTANG
jgi:transcription-repair coupling factor (superfamily II helicase)